MMKKFIPLILLAITPLIFAPFTLNFFTINKQIFIILIALVLIIKTGINHLITKKHLHPSSLFTFALAFFAAATGLNLLMTQEARIESLIGRGMLFIALAAISYAISISKRSLKDLTWALAGLITAGTALAFHGILQLVILSNMTKLPVWMQSPAFTPAGSPLILITIIVVSLVATLAWAVKEIDLTKKTSLFTAAGIQLAALVTYGFMLNKGEVVIQLLPLKAGWGLTLDSLKNVRELFLGIGLANFPVLFTQAKPAFLVQTELWTTIFQTSSNEILHLLTTTGVIGLIAFGLLLFATVKSSLKIESSPQVFALKLALYTVILSFFLVPANIVSYTFFFTLAGLIAANSFNQNKKEVLFSGYTHIISAIVLGALVVVTGLFSYRVYAAEVFMRQAQQAFTQNDAEGVYLKHIRAVQLMPQIADYRISLSQINMTLASSLSRIQAPDQETGEVAQLTDQQREQISLLIQRAIEQGQVASQLRPSLYSPWQNLGVIYRNLINIASGAQDFAIQHLGQAVTRDPANPLLRIEYGGLFYQLSQLVEDPETQTALIDQAIQQFQVAARLRPNYANSYYNLANAFDKKGSYRLAYQAMTQALANLEPDSTDYLQAQNALLDLEAKLPQAPEQQPIELDPQQPAQSILQQPAPLPSPLPGGPVDLPEEARLEIPSPTPQPEETQTTPQPNQDLPIASPSPESTEQPAQ
jgi:tetratricopeptide (TPR) repeat protein